MDRQQITVTYAGRRLDRNRKLFHLYMYEGERITLAKPLYPASVGTQISVDTEAREGGQRAYFTGTAKYAGRTEGELVTQWAAEDRAAIGEAEAAKQAKNVDPFREQLKPLRDTYVNLSGPGRAALITAVIREMTSWG